jgi:hypothetical protein
MKGFSNKIDKATKDLDTGLENKPEFLENLVHALSKNSISKLESGLIVVAVGPFTKSFSQTILQRIAYTIKEIDFDHSSRYGNYFSMLNRISTEGDLDAALTLFKENFGELTQKYNLQFGYAKLLVPSNRDAQKIITELEDMAYRALPESAR